MPIIVRWIAFGGVGYTVMQCDAVKLFRYFVGIEGCSREETLKKCMFYPYCITMGNVHNPQPWTNEHSPPRTLVSSSDEESCCDRG